MENKIFCSLDDNIINIYNFKYNKDDIFNYIKIINDKYKYIYKDIKPVYMIHNDRIYYDYNKSIDNICDYELNGNTVILKLERASFIASYIKDAFLTSKFINFSSIINLYNYMYNQKIESKYCVIDNTDIEIKLNKNEKYITPIILDNILDELFKKIEINYVGNMNINNIKSTNKNLKIIRNSIINKNINIDNKKNKKIKTK